MQRGIAVAMWFAHEARRVYAALGFSGGDPGHADLLRWMRRRNGPVTVREVARGPRRLRSVEDASRVLENLVRANLAWRVLLPPPPKGGKTARAYSLRNTSGDGDVRSGKGQKSGGSGERTSPGAAEEGGPK